jgi:hypothetical protein
LRSQVATLKSSPSACGHRFPKRTNTPYGDSFRGELETNLASGQLLGFHEFPYSVDEFLDGVVVRVESLFQFVNFRRDLPIARQHVTQANERPNHKHVSGKTLRDHNCDLKKSVVHADLFWSLPLCCV